MENPLHSSIIGCNVTSMWADAQEVWENETEWQMHLLNFYHSFCPLKSENIYTWYFCNN